MVSVNAADALLGQVLLTGWEVIEKIDKPTGSTGSFFSICYKVKRNNDICFLKALNFGAFFSCNDGKKAITEVLTEMLDVHKYEKQLSQLCQDHHASKVSFVKESGEITLNGYTIGLVPYLIFELADGDVRNLIDFSKKLDVTWRLKSLHEIAVGINQLHKINISHQDLKPSNILLFCNETKIGDLGRSLCSDIKSPYELLPFTGDFNYAPPEIIYDYHDKDWKKRAFAIDTYLLGSLIVFYFTGISMTALLMKNLDDSFKPPHWSGTFDVVKPYLIDAFSKSLEEFYHGIESDELKIDLKDLVQQLCYPLPEIRGHRKNVNTINHYGLDRFITKLDILNKKSICNLYRLNNG
ncbi:MAG: protein kinase [bacterium]